MTKKQLEKLKPFLETLNQEQLKVIWYIEAIKKGNPCITEKQKEEALKKPLIDLQKIKLHDWSHEKENNIY